jgi:hypothetical protein
MEPTMKAHAAVFAIGIALLGCSKKVDRGEAPPPASAPSASAGICVAGGGRVSDPMTASFFPRVVQDYCLDPNGETRAYGESAPAGIEGVCLEQFDGECEVYKGYGLDRLVTARYVDGRGGSGEVSVALSRFATKDGAYGFYTRRLLGGADPLKATTDPLAAGGAGALGTGVAYVWRGVYVAQLTYSNVSESPDQLKQSSGRILPGLGRALGDRLPGELELPAAARLLPDEARIKLGVEVGVKDLLGVSGVGGGAIGYHQEGERRWRTIALIKSDDAAAKDVLRTFGKLPGAKTEKGLTFEAVTFSLRPPASAKTDWIVARKANMLLGIGDEELVLGGTLGPDEVAKLCLPRDAKLERLKRWVESGPAAAGSARAH